jgi:hypothetical protein
MVLDTMQSVDLKPLAELERKIEDQINERARSASIRPEEVSVIEEQIIEMPKSPTPVPEPKIDLEIAAVRKTVTGRHKPNLKSFKPNPPS